MKDINLGRCNSCSINNDNSGYFGYYMSIGNCRSSNSKNVCDIVINVLDKRHECPGATSLTECLYVNPQKILYYNRNLPNGPALLEEYTGSNIANAIANSKNIQGNEISYTLLNRMVRPCGEGLSDIYNGPREPGCLPYSDNLLTQGTKCPNGSPTMYTKCCKDPPNCTQTNCNACSVKVSYPDTDPKWKEDVCYYMCPSYWTQRTFLQETGTIKESQLCSTDYAQLCELAGCDIDVPCKIRWGGCASYRNIDSDLCNGGDWTSAQLTYAPINECKDGTTGSKNFCKKYGLCATGTYTKKCTNLPGLPAPPLPTILTPPNPANGVWVLPTKLRALTGSKYGFAIVGNSLMATTKPDTMTLSGGRLFAGSLEIGVSDSKISIGPGTNWELVPVGQYLAPYAPRTYRFLATRQDGTQLGYLGIGVVPKVTGEYPAEFVTIPNDLSVVTLE